jgi:5-dehydro-4-deoxyglucarate dehydratase
VDETFTAVVTTMNPTALRRALSSGVIGFPITPFHADGSLDLDGLRRNVDAMASHGFCALVAAGGTGELYSLSPAEHRDVVRVTVEAATGRMPIIAGVGGSVAVATGLARESASAGAHGILALPPYYPGADEAGLLAYYRDIGAATDRGLLVYSRDWVNPGPAFVTRLAEAAPTLIAWKDGQGDMRRLQIVMGGVGDRLLWIGGAGDDLVGAYYRLGIRTYTSSISNVAPKLSLRLHDLAAAGDETTLAALLREHVVPLYALRARRKGYEVSAMKAMMEPIGLVGGPVRPPLVEVTDAERAELKKMVEGWREYL